MCSRCRVLVEVGVELNSFFLARRGVPNMRVDDAKWSRDLPLRARNAPGRGSTGHPRKQAPAAFCRPECHTKRVGLCGPTLLVKKGASARPKADENGTNFAALFERGEPGLVFIPRKNSSIGSGSRQQPRPDCKRFDHILCSYCVMKVKSSNPFLQHLSLSSIG
jgi:hypothetical protein